MSADDGVLAQLRGGAASVAEGRFSLDAARAFDKLRRFQLADPRRYVALLLRAATLRGATTITARVIEDDVFELTFDGTPFTRDELEGLWLGALGDGHAGTASALQELALGCNAARALPLARLVIESGADAPLRLQVLAEGDDVVSTGERPIDGTRITVALDRRRGVIPRAERGDRRFELAIIRELAAFARARVTVGRAMISRGFSALAVTAATDVGPGRAGRCGWAEGGGEAEIVVLQHQIVLTRHVLTGVPAGFQAVVDGSDLVTDVSRTEPVDNAAWQTLLAEVERAARRSLAVLARAPLPLPDWVLTAVRGVLERSGAAIVDTTDPDLRTLVELPLWQRLDGTKVGTHVLAAAERVQFCAPRSEDTPPRFADAVVVASDADRRLLLSLLPRAVPVDGLLAAAAERARSQRIQANGPFALADDATAWLPPHTGVYDGIDITVAGVGDDPATRLRFVRDTVCERDTRCDMGLPGVVVTLAADAVGVAGDEGIVRALLAAHDAIDVAIGRAIAAGSGGGERGARLRVLTLGHLHGLVTGAAVRASFAAHGLDPAAWAERIADAGNAPRPRLEPADLPIPAAFELPVLDAIERRPGRACGNGRTRVSLRELSGLAEGEVVVATADTAATIDAPRLVVIADACARAVLEAAFGRERLAAWSPRGGDQGRVRFLAGKQIWSARFAPALAGPHAYVHDGLSCSVAIERGRIRGPRRELAIIRVIRERRSLCELSWPCPVPGLVASVAGDDIAANAAWNGLADREAHARIEAAVAVGLELLVAQMLAAVHAGTDDRDRDEVLLAAAGAIGSPVSTQAGVLHQVVGARASELGQAPLLGTIARASSHEQRTRGALGTLVPATPSPTPAPPRPAPSIAVTPSRPQAAPSEATATPVVPSATPADPLPPIATPPTIGTAEPSPPPPSIEPEPVPASGPEQRMIDAVVTTIAAIRRAAALPGHARLANFELAALGGPALVEASERRVVINRSHPIVAALLGTDPPDPALVDLVASAAYTAVNVAIAEITDADELTFHRAHAGWTARRPP